jgi:hypothetical protein
LGTERTFGKDRARLKNLEEEKSQLEKLKTLDAKQKLEGIKQEIRQLKKTEGSGSMFQKLFSWL